MCDYYAYAHTLLCSTCPVLTLLQEQPKPVSSEDKENVNKGRMTGERCGYLIAVAMANRLHEVWISPNPILLFTYIVQYMPTIAKW